MRRSAESFDQWWCQGFCQDVGPGVDLVRNVEDETGYALLLLDGEQTF